MKVYVHNQGIVLAGKAWEINAKLKESKQHFEYVEDWVKTIHSRPTLRLVHNAPTTVQKKAGSS